MDKNTQQDIEKYWKDKEQEIGEDIQGKEICEYISGYQEITERCWGLLYHTERSFYFQTFPRKNWLISLLRGGQAESSGKTLSFRILWDEVLEINLPVKRNNFLSILAPPDYRVFIQYQIDKKPDTLVLMMYSRDNREKFMKFYRKLQNI